MGAVILGPPGAGRGRLLDEALRVRVAHYGRYAADHLGVDDVLAARRESVVAVSPIVGGAALKGPADRMLTELGHEASVVGVARLYAPIAGTLVIDPLDAHLAADVEALGMRAVVTDSVMRTPAIAHSLASTVLSCVRLP